MTGKFDKIEPRWRDDYDWREAFQFARNIRTATCCSALPFTLEDVSIAEYASEGQNDSESWMMVGRLGDGRWFFLDAWCDYTGWDCQAWGDSQVAATLRELIRFGMTEDARRRLGLTLDA